jgi:uncharacterized protein (TIGR00369 family)
MSTDSNIEGWDERLPTRQLPPHGQALGIEYVKVEDGCLFLKVPYAEHLVGDPDTGIIHGGVITAAMDNASGWCTRLNSDFVEGQSMATLDLRIDYMKPATPHKDLMVRAECYKMTRNIAFVRATAFQEDLLDPVATSVASFMMGTPSERKPA